MTTNHLEEIILKYPTAPYDWIALSLNSAISFEFIKNNRNFQWNISAVSRNNSITESIVRSNLDFPWSYKDLCANPNISFDFMLEFAIKPTAKVDLNWNELSKNESISMEIIDQYHSYPWSDTFISCNPNISSNYILNNGKNRKWVMAYVSANKAITERDIYKKLLDFNYTNLSSNPNLPAKYINDNLSYNWNMHSVSSNPNITPTDIETYHNIPWDYNGFSINKNISMNYVLNKKNQLWSAQYLLTNSAITLKDIDNNLDYFDSLISNKEKYISSNPNITINWIEKNIRLIDWKRLSMNNF